MKETKPSEGEGKSKRKMKTASQLAILEKTYAVEQYPPEAMRIELSAQLGLSDRQLQMWFCHRRLKDRKAPTAKRARKDSPIAVPAVLPGGDVAAELVPGSAFGSGPLAHPVDPWRGSGRVGTAVARISGDFPAMKRYYEPQLSVAERRAIASVEAQLGEPLREDGPILGMEFDPLPPDAFGAPIGGTPAALHKQSRRAFEAKYDRPEVKLFKDVRPVHEYQFLPEKPSVRSESYERAEASYPYSTMEGTSSTIPSRSVNLNEQASSGYVLQGQMPTLNLLTSPPVKQGQSPGAGMLEYLPDPRRSSLSNVELRDELGTSVTALDTTLLSSDRRLTHEEDVLQTERKRKNEEATIARELEAHEKRIRKELKRQDKELKRQNILRRKREEQIRKEMERHDRERRKEEERLLREKQREEDRYLREQRRELERREKFLQKESIKAEKMKQKEELRRAKEAARLKAASERANARRMARESMELIEDARLELMEVAASSKGLPSIGSLDFETMQNLELFRDSLPTFPPKSVQLKRPFAVQPWLHSEENVGNLLMVWRFLITFTDVLNLWPFTLDEFVQAFHDYDGRLLDEIHISLLRSIIKDIEDVARTPSGGPGANQYTAANPGGGHLNIVEGAYAWGFDIRSWQRHLNPLTWPEILRQLALSAGFGPQLKKRDVDSGYVYDDNEGNDGEDIISTLRNGAAAENAFSIMQERGYSNRRRSRHRLTPGTVKYAAFHVLSVEGSEGLNILDVAEKIQKSGLRDLTTSKTPEASISAALSRDTKLFERTAPSTYCVRTPYRKDPADAEAILTAARDRIHAFKSGVINGEEADDAERDEDSESDSGEDPEVDDLGTEPNSNKEVLQKDADKLETTSLLNNVESGDMKQTKLEIQQNGLDEQGSTLSYNQSTAGAEISKIDQQETDIDESIAGEPWVQGLMEGEYSDLSVEERLHALVALIGVAIEGHSIRLVLEERLEAATALKKQMWAEAQLDKRRIKEDYLVKMYPYPPQTGNNINPSSANGRQSPWSEVPMDPSSHQEQMTEGNLQMQDISGGYVAEKSRSQLKSYIGYKVEEMYVYRSLPLGQDRRRNRYWQFVTAVSRNDPGCGRIFVELLDGRWRLIDSEMDFDALLAALDVRGLRESNLHSMLRRIESTFKETVRMNSLRRDVKSEPVDIASDIGNGSPSSSPGLSGRPDLEVSEPSTSFLIELGRNPTEKNDAFKRYQDFEKWMWKECLHSPPLLCAIKYGNKRSLQLLRACDHCCEVYLLDDDYCPSCHGKYLDFAKHLDGSVSSPVRMRLLKLLLSLIEASIPEEAVAHIWTDHNRESWGHKLNSSLSAEDLLQALSLLEGAVLRDFLSSRFETTCELLGCSNLLESPDVSADLKVVPVLPWVPKTTAAVALRFMGLDSAISYTLQQKADSDKDEGTADLNRLPLNFTALRNTPNHGIPESRYSSEPFVEDSWVDPAVLLGSSGRGRGGRGRARTRTGGGRSQRRSLGARSASARRSRGSNAERLGNNNSPTLRGRPRGRGKKRGRRSIRNNNNKQKAPQRVDLDLPKTDIPEEIEADKPLEVSVEEEWNADDNAGMLPYEESENGSSSERSEYCEENGGAPGYEYDDLMADDYGGGFVGKSAELEGGNNEEDDEDDVEEEEDLGVEGYINGDSDEGEGTGGGDGDADGDGDGDAFGDVGPDEGTAYSSSEYSDEDNS